MNALNAVEKLYPVDTAKLSEVKGWFTHHPASEEQEQRYNALREEANHLAIVILRLTPPSEDQSAALRHLRECVWTANAAIANEKRD